MVSLNWAEYKIQNVCQHGFGNNRLIRLGLSKKKSTLRV